MADPQFQPSAFTRALIAAANPNPTPEDLAIIAQAKAEAAEQGMSDYVNEALAGIAAAASSNADPAAASGADNDRAQALTVEFEQLIKRERQRAKDVDGTTYEAVITASVLPTTPDRNLARRFARQSALLRRFGRHGEAVSAAAEACERYVDRTDLDDAEKGYYAYSMLLVAEDHLARRDVERAGRVAATAMPLFIRYRQQLLPVGIPDIVRAGLVLAQCQAQRGAVGDARQTVVDIRYLADSLDSSFAGPVGAAGAMPGGWGLPVVLSKKDWKALRKRLATLAKQLRV